MFCVLNLIKSRLKKVICFAGGIGHHSRSTRTNADEQHNERNCVVSIRKLLADGSRAI